MFWYIFFLGTFLTVSFVSGVCPAWHYYSNTTDRCECGYLLSCSSDANEVEVRSVYCATPLGQEGDYYIIKDSLFLYISENGSRVFSKMPGNTSQLEEVMCSPHNRKGFVCSDCIDGYGPAVFSLAFNCAKCTGALSRYGITIYLIIQFIPTTLIFLFLVFFRFNITSGPLLGFIIFCQAYNVFIIEYRLREVIVSILMNASEPWNMLTVIIQTLTNFWTLSFSTPIIPPFCISEKLTLIDIQLIELFVATYPLALVITACILVELHSRNWKIVRCVCKPFQLLLKKANITLLVTSDAIFRAFASLFLLSNINVMIGMLKLIHNRPIYNATGVTQKSVLIIDPSVEWLHHKHIMYLLIATVPFLLASLFPSLLLLIYPTRLYRYLSRFLSARKRLAITAFAEAIHSCFKDGLNGTTDYRAMGAINLLFLVPLVHYFSVGYLEHYLSYALILVLACVISYMRPCKEKIANISFLYYYFLYITFTTVSSLWWNDSSFGTHTLEVALIATGLASHLLVALWASYILTRLVVRKLKLRFGSNLQLSDVPERIKFCFWRRNRSYQELQEQSNAE